MVKCEKFFTLNVEGVGGMAGDCPFELVVKHLIVGFRQQTSIVQQPKQPDCWVLETLNQSTVICVLDEVDMLGRNFLFHQILLNGFEDID